MSIVAALNVARKYASGGAVETNPPVKIKKHINFQGLKISIETPKGEIRRGVDHEGKPWANRMAADYGYIQRTEGKDGDQVDAFVGPFRNSDKVFIIDQLHHHKEKFDEHKCLLGFNTRKQALTAYHNSYGRVYGHHHTVGAVTELSIDAFKEWLKGGGGKEPVAPDVPKYQDGGLVFDPDYLKTKSEKTPNVRVAEGHQEFEKGYVPSGRSPWNTSYHYRPILNMRGQELDALKIKTGGTVKATKETANYRLGTKSEHCAICTMFRVPDSCTAVRGKIRQQDTCNYFEMKRKKYAEGGGTKLGIPTSDALTEITHQPMATAWRGSTFRPPTVVYRGTETGPTAEEALSRRSSIGDLGSGHYVTPSYQIGSSYGGGPKASVKAGTRTVHSYEFNRELEPNEIAHVYGGSKYNEPVQIVRGDGTELYNGPWGAKQMESALSEHPNIKAVFGDPESIGINQINVRDPSILSPKARGGQIRKYTMPLKKGSSKATISQNISEFHTGPTYAATKAKFGKAKADKQAIAAAMSTARKYGKGKAFGGPNIESMIMRGASYGLRREGMINSTIPGRTDKLPMNVRTGSYVLPADIPSALGQGNSFAGGEILKKMFNSGPYGLPTMRSAGRSGMALSPRISMRAPRIPRGAFQDGGETEGKDHVPIIAAGGEYLIHPDVVKDIGHGNINTGHRVLDKFVLSVRKKYADTLKKLPGPKK